MLLCELFNTSREPSGVSKIIRAVRDNRSIPRDKQTDEIYSRLVRAGYQRSADNYRKKMDDRARGIHTPASYSAGRKRQGDGAVDLTGGARSLTDLIPTWNASRE